MVYRDILLLKDTLLTKLILQVKSDKDLFEEWQSQCHMLMLQSSIIQNDMEIEGKELLEWDQEITQQIRSLLGLKNKIKAYVAHSKTRTEE